MASGYEQTIWNYFVDKLGNEYGVAGLMGNLFAESGLYPNNLQNTYNNSLGMTDEEYTNAVNNGTYTASQFINDEAGYGIAQWTYWSRKEGLYEYFQSGTYTGINDIFLQMDYLWYELNWQYNSVLQVLKSATTIREASNAVLHDFEDPADQSTAVENLREQYSIGYYNDFVGSYEGGDDDPSVTTKTKRKNYNFTLFNHRRRKQWIKGMMY